MTVLEVLTAATGFLKKKGIESPRLNAEHLLAHVLGMDKRITLYLEFERPLSDAERAPLRDLIRRRSEGVPLQHLLGTVEFCGRVFGSDSRALIARPETEQLVEFVLPHVPESSLVVDIGTGSGVIALSLALARPSASVTAVDVSPDALALARENATRHGVAERVAFVESDLLASVEGQFDVVVANLPYIPTGELSCLSREVLHDPSLALDGGSDGLALIARFVSDAPRCLSPGGLLALEIGHDQADRVESLLMAHNYRDIVRQRDYQQVERFVFARHG